MQPLACRHMQGAVKCRFGAWGGRCHVELRRRPRLLRSAHLPFPGLKNNHIVTTIIIIIIIVSIIMVRIRVSCKQKPWGALLEAARLSGGAAASTAEHAEAHGRPTAEEAAQKVKLKVVGQLNPFSDG